MSVEATRLTPRQVQIAKLIARDLRYRQIGKRLGIGEGTVKAHARQIFIRLDLHSRLELSLWVRDHLEHSS